MATQPRPRLIRGGTIVDGTGAPRFEADVRVRDGRIVEVAPGLAPAADEVVVEAAGCLVTPGFIETHTHYDGAMWWHPELDPLPGYGVTTMVMGNCGFSLAPAPADPAARHEIVKIFSFFEDIPEKPFFSELPWDWRRWSEYRASLVGNVRLPVHFGAFVGHIAIRLAVMGMDAWERAATEDEIARMAALLEDALAAGAMGLSSNLFDHDGHDRPVPTLLADDAELSALLDVIERHEGAIFQVIVDIFRNMTCVESVERLARLCRGRRVRVQYGGIPTLTYHKSIGLQDRMIALHEKLRAEGLDFWTAFAHVPITGTVSVLHSLLFAQSNEYVWNEVVELPNDGSKERLMRDPAWRARARQSWDHEAFEFSSWAPRQREQIMLLNSANDVGPIGISLGDYARELGVHPSDAMAEWLLANGLESTITMAPWAKDEEMVLRLLRDPKAAGNVSDAGAHGQMLCGPGQNLELFTHYVQERGDLTVEEAVQSMTGRLAEHFSLRDRGTIAVGKRADLAVFALDEIDVRPMKKIYDVPDGEGGTTWRWTRDPAPMRLTLVGGEATFENGEATPARPGEMVRPG
ncbi:MAG: amidohydrolase family protein [Spirochaetaceae bacterium]|nr:amidohydrolase family protein [Spirochaetaceae bacterium]